MSEISLTSDVVAEEIAARANVIEARWALIEPRTGTAIQEHDIVSRLLANTSMPLWEKLAAHGMHHPKVQIQAAQEVGCDLASTCAMLEMETSGGWNEWGSDPVSNPVRGSNGYHWVNERNYAEYLKFRNEGRGCQGCGSTQLTSAGLQDEADKLGGCWVIEHNMHIGFLFIHQLQKEYGLEGGFQHYNGSGPAAVAYGEHAMGLRDSYAAAIG